MKNYLKFSSIGAALAMCGVIIAMHLDNKASAQSSRQLQPAIVILECSESYAETAAGPQFNGFEVFNSSSSEGAPIFANHSSLADDTSVLMAQGFRLFNVVGLIYTFVR
jgi:hypothetical protein